MKMLIARDMDVNSPNKKGETVLHRACDGRLAAHNGVGAFVRHLLRAGADPGAVDSRGRTPLLALAMTAQHQGGDNVIEVAEILLDADSDPNAAIQGGENVGDLRPLESALRNGK